MIYPIPIFTNAGEGHAGAFLGLYITLNMLIVLFWIVRALVYLFNKKVRILNSFWGYAIFNEDSILTGIVMAIFALINITAIVFMLMELVIKLFHLQ